MARIRGTAADDLNHSTTFNDRIFCGAGNDFASGSEGNDSVRDDTGNDGLSGGNSSDRLFGEREELAIWSRRSR